MTQQQPPRDLPIPRHSWRRNCLRILLPIGLAALLGCGNAKSSATGKTAQEDSGRNAILQQPFDMAAKLVLLNVGRAYEMCLVQGKPPKDKDELDALLTTTRDGKKRVIEVIYGVDPKKLPDDGVNHRLAWEKEPTNDGHRMVLMADGKTVKYLSQEEFDKTPRAK
jgi:hypothetical protein